MIGGALYEYTTESALHCGRECLADPRCQGFALYRNVQPAGGVTCRRYETLSSIVYDESTVTYFTANATMPSE